MAQAGKGKALLLGTLVGHNALAYQNADTPALVLRLLELVGTAPLQAGKLLKRVRQTAGKQAWFFTNPTGETVTENIAVGSARVEDLLGESIDRQANHVVLTVQPLDVRVLIVSTM
jgi:hypothetical protein